MKIKYVIHRAPAVLHTEGLKIKIHGVTVRRGAVVVLVDVYRERKRRVPSAARRNRATKTKE